MKTNSIFTKIETASNSAEFNAFLGKCEKIATKAAKAVLLAIVLIPAVVLFFLYSIISRLKQESKMRKQLTGERQTSFVAEAFLPALVWLLAAIIPGLLAIEYAFTDNSIYRTLAWAFCIIGWLGSVLLALATA